MCGLSENVNHIPSTLCFMCVCVCVCVYIQIKRERERERERERDLHRGNAR